MANYPEQLQLEIESALAELFPPQDSCPDQLYEAMQYSLFLPAKRFRPILASLSAKAVCGEYRFVMPTACAIEYIHTYSLIHDDLPAIDDDDLRRGQPTCHCRFGEDIAILAGDALFAEAFALIASKQAGRPETILQIIGEIAAASGISGMVGGQTADVIASGRDISLNDLEYIHNCKTGSLIKVSIRAGALLAEADPEILKALTSYSISLGLAFQIIDDILDITGSTVDLGKPSHSDEAKDKATFPKLVGLDEAQQLAAQAVKQAKMSLVVLGESSKELCEIADYVLERSR